MGQLGVPPQAQILHAKLAMGNQCETDQLNTVSANLDNLTQLGTA